jgi:hypothetical protein
MTATTFPTTLPSPPAGVTGSGPAPARWRHAVSDAVAVTGRNLLAYVRLPELAVFSSI